ncbi:glycosyltransferase family 2 protein [Geomesophilobacter sediminis]|uniref:Glycosyltransferase family 2 protein n=1 Tax=Geomesophilobacter sediminis TaxID=2798584 RepID=A0A8J7JML0_9BACT|nr:glycosyltransferase family 2 protein [Geomesophilobacter sediminis]MBJ6725945.1 glycosyltransferase family 2 protein [Geomesophilobacter sediminis]
MRGNLSVGVIVSTYNSPAYLARVLEGYRLQSRYPDELIVADDGSGPETAQVVEEFAARAPFPVRHVWHEDNGFRLAEIRNRAIARAESDYLIFTDGDCVPHPCFVADHARAFRPGSFVTGKRMLVGKDLSPTFLWKGFAGALASCLTGGLSGGHHLVRLPWYNPGKKGIRGLRGCNIAVARADLLEINGFNEQIVGWGREDSELVGRLFALGRSRRETPFSAIVFHLWHPENSRASLEENDRLLKESLESGSYRCPCGIVKE